MGLFQHKSDPLDEADAQLPELFDDLLREELKQHGKEYFERTISKSAAQFKKDLDVVVSQIGTELREQIVTKLDKQIAEYGESMKDAQYLALQSLNRSQHSLQDKYDQLSKQLDEEFVQYSSALKNAQATALGNLDASAIAMQKKHDELSAQLDIHFTEYAGELKQAQTTALESLGKNAQTMQEQYVEFKSALEKKISDQEATIITGFENNMASIIEHYLIGALGEGYDMKAQMPSILAELEANKQAMTDDMRL